MRFRRKIRKWKLLSILAEHGMCPITKEELNVWETAGKYPIENQAFIGWLKSTDASNPYLDRAKAARETVDPMTLGRALYHICQRRGFKSSRKGTFDNEDNPKSAKELGVVKNFWGKCPFPLRP